ncbi:hypothetical protein Ddc_06371 [Ditylenchus destructor]|nr:hypothetical protein Ddc_06371 [Ditylenchus destructor]
MRKPSVSAQLTRTARRFSTVIAPQLTKVEQLNILQKYRKLIIKMADVTRLQDAIKQYVLHNNMHFDPVEFQIRSCENGSDQVVLLAQFYAEEIVLFEGTKRLLSICLSDPPDTSVEGITVAKVRHPISGIKVFEVIEATGQTSWKINGSLDELNKCHIEAHHSLLRHMVSMCGFSFSSGQWWSVEHEGSRVGQVCPLNSFCDENSLRIEWLEDTDNELRLLTLCFGVIQMVREAFPGLMHIVHECRQRKGIA